MIEKERPQVISHLTQKLMNNPASRAFVPLADEYLRQNQLDDAIAVLTEGIGRHPTYVAARMMLGNACQRAGRITEAKRAFEEVVRIHPENALAYKKLAVLYRDAGQMGETVEMCNKALMIDPHDRQAKSILAFAHEEISSVEDRESGSLPDISFAIPSSSMPVPDWPELKHQEMEPSQESYPSQGTLPPQESHPSIQSDTAPVEESDIVLTDPLPQEDILVEEKAETMTEISFASPSLVFAGNIGYNRSALHRQRLKEWLVSIQNKGAIRR